MCLKRILSLLIIVCLCFSFAAAASAEGSTSEEKAVALNKLGILKGNGSDYNLGGRLKRSEAAAFIVRIMAREKEVLSNKAEYANTRFPDVDSQSWYAPYVGYCAEEGIISGYMDGNFGPEDNISEMAFLKLVMGAIGYREGTDFTYNKVYQAAYQVGLLEDGSYQGKTEDNREYTRDGVVNVLYNALNIIMTDTKLTVIQNLIAQGVVTRETAEAAGVIKDSVPASIESVTAEDENRISVKLNEEVENIPVENIGIYETDKTGNALSVSIESQNGAELVIKTADQTPDTEYTIELHDIKDLEGNWTPSLTATFSGYRNPEIVSDYFKISKVEPVNENEVTLYFTHPINANSENTSFYQILEEGGSFVEGGPQNLSVKALSSKKNAVSICLRNKTFKDGARYTINVSGSLTSAFGVKLLDGQGDSIQFTGKGIKNEGLLVSGIGLVDKKTLAVQFNREISPSLAEKAYYYDVLDSDENSIKVEKAVLGGEEGNKGKVVYITISGSFSKGGNYELLINYITDVTKLYSINEQKIAFTADYSSEKNDLAIDSAAQIDANTVIAYFNKPLDADAAVSVNNYIITGVSTSSYSALPIKAFYDPADNPYVVKLYLPEDKPLKSSKTYKLKMYNTLEDLYGNKPSKSSEFTFTASTSETAKPEVGEAVIISSDAIRVTFSKEVAIETPNILVSNYTVEYTDNGTTITKVPLSVTPFDATTFILKFDVLNPEESYTLKYTSLKDYSGAFTRTASDGDNKIDVKAGKQ
ncbi:MAG: S-layer homology domain-containing protein [Clostridiales bacterium]|jgi:hypothetical protein|nr:S-layer homology domain-containing protein [Eubacteriales bacterium]MDH7567779.1 S-layer homology domain-containing protein [Clostridiales bacterium]